MTDKLTEIAMAICGVRCYRQQAGLGSCILPNGRNGPCQATETQLILSGKMETAKAAIAAHEAALKAEGLVIVPREPSEAMLLAGARSIGKTMGTANHIERARSCWQAMLAALEVKDADKE